MVLDLAKIRQVLAVARTGSFHRAADELGLTQPALSRNIALLEARFGFRFFDRGRGGTSLTRLGERAIADAEALVRHAAVVESNFELYGRGEIDQIAFGMGPQIASLLLPKLGAQMLATRPRVRMHCSVRTSDLLAQDLRDDVIEMMFCASDHVPDAWEVDIETLGAVSVEMLARAEHPLAGRGPVRMSELGNYPLASATDLLPRAFPRENGALIWDSPELLRAAVLETDALWLSSAEAFAADIAAGRLVEIAVADLPFRRTDIGVVRLKGRTPSPAAISLVDHARALLTPLS